MVGQNIRRLIPAQLQAEEDEILARIRAGEFIDHFETIRMTKDGRRLDVSLSISPIKNDAGEVVGAAKIARDMTARKLADEQLIATTAKFETVFNQSGIFAGIMDPDGTLREINTWPSTSAATRGSRCSTGPSGRHPGGEARKRCRSASAPRPGRRAPATVFRETLPYWIADGSERIVDFSMHPIRDQQGVVWFLHPAGIDITERTRAEEALRAREAEEREIAVALQRSLLPERLELPPSVACAARYEAGSEMLEVGGDWYDAFLLPDGRVAFTVGDVVGHGVAAAAAMGQLRTALAALGEYASSPGELLTQARRVPGPDELDRFRDRLLRRARSVERPARVRLGGAPSDGSHLADRRRTLARRRPVAAALRRPRAGPFGRCHGSEARLHLVLYSDGLIERRGEHIQEGLDRLARAARDLPGLPVERGLRSPRA